MTDAVRAWWSLREAREKWLIALAIILSLVLGIYQFALVPSASYRGEQRRAFEAALEARALVSTAIAQRASRREPERENQPLQSVLTRTSDLYGLSIARLAPGDDGGLNVWLEGVPPQLLYAWIGELERTHGVRVAKASLRREEAGEALTANLYMRREG
jgi:type II secretory pathway component PulM